MNKKYSLVVTLMLLCFFLPTEHLKVSASTTLSSSQISNYFNSKVGVSGYKDSCLKFVADMFRDLGATRDSACCAYNYGVKRLESSSRDNIPIGADVFFSGHASNISATKCKTCGNVPGHVGVYVGDGYMVHAYSAKIQKMKIDTVVSHGYKYMGWGVHGNIIIDDVTPTPSSCNCFESYAGTYTTKNVNTNLNIRSGHGSNYSLVGKIPAGAELKVTKANGTWAHVQYNGINGYASMDYLSKKSCTTHTYSGWTVQTAATCTTDGTQTRKCTACGYTESGTIAKTGHSYGSWTVSKAATCTTDGTNTRKCSKCGNTETSAIAKTGHSYGSWTVSKAATCTTDGTNTRKCSKCGNAETSTIAKTGHNYVDNNVSATCTKDGKTEKKCKNCNDTITTVIKATGHKYGEWTVSKNATCTSDGTKVRKCSVCNASETASVAKTGHDYSETVIKPSCTAKGYTLYKCKVCEDAYKDKYTDFAPHNYELTDGKKAECLNCSNVCVIPFEGSGTQEDPFKISTAKDLFNLAEVVNNKDTNNLFSECYYIQTADIDLQNEKFTPIGIRLVDGLEAGLSFFGSYNGQYHTIKNLYVERNVKFAGLFGSVKGSGIIENLIVEGKVVSSGPAVGGIIGEICNGGAIIRNCAFIGDVNSSSNAVGGVVGYLWLNGTIENCYHNGTVTNTGESRAGGVVGATGGVVGAITAGKELDTNTSVKKCYHIGEIKTTVPEHASTIVGFSEDLSETTGNVIITDCYAVKGEAYQAFGGTATQKEIIEISNNMLKIAYIDLGEPFVQAPDDSINNGYPVFEWQLGSSQTSLSIGDINNDSKCDITDLTYISLYLLGDVEFDDLQKDAADVNADGCIDIADLAHYKQFVSKDNVVLGK